MITTTSEKLAALKDITIELFADFGRFDMIDTVCTSALLSIPN